MQPITTFRNTTPGEMALADAIVAGPISREELKLALLLQRAAFMETNPAKASPDWPAPLYIIQAHAIYKNMGLAGQIAAALPLVMIVEER